MLKDVTVSRITVAGMSDDCLVEGKVSVWGYWVNRAQIA